MPPPAPRLAYDRGTLTWPGLAPPTPHFRADPRTGTCRARALDYGAVAAALREAGVAFEDRALDPLPAPPLRAPGLALRPYQEAALDAWRRAGMRGVVVMPTGAGKTVVALKAIEAAQAATLVVAPTLDLVDQWRARLREAFDAPVGVQAGGARTLEALTVATYDGAYLRAPRWGNRFRLVVFDEAHHLPSEGYRHVAEMLCAPLRLGLTATPARADGLHERLPRLTGPVVHEVRAETLAGRHLAPYAVERVETELTPAERARYEAHRGVVDALLGERPEFRGPEGHRRLVMRSATDPRAREALLAREAARDVMMNGEAKLEALARVLERHAGERVLVFTGHNRLALAIRRRFLVPALTHRTPPSERAELLEAFRAGRCRVLATGNVLDEGVDVPAASVGVILSGSGSRREYVQRLGRLLRPAPGKQARLYEIVSRDTLEEATSARRRREGARASP